MISAMYQDYFRFNDKPFSIAPNPRYLYMSAQHCEALAHLSYGLHECGGFIVLSGEVGAGTATLCRRQSDCPPAPAREVSAGKTTLCRRLLEQIQRKPQSAGN